METPTYHYRKGVKRKPRWRRVSAIFVLLVLLLAGLIGYDVYRGRSRAQSGQVKTSQLTFDKDGPKLKIEEPTFTMTLPGDWKETKRYNSPDMYGIVWQATREKEDNRYLTLYIDRLPRNLAYNRLLPLEAFGQNLRHGSVSENCSTFTETGSRAARNKEVLAKWEEVSFMCDLPKYTDNIIGTSSKEGINLVSVSGPLSGKHSYFFTYTDHNIHPNYQIFLDAIKSFQAK